MHCWWNGESGNDLVYTAGGMVSLGMTWVCAAGQMVSLEITSCALLVEW